MPDTIIPVPQPSTPPLRPDVLLHRSPDEAVRIARRPLPRHDLHGGNYRRWAAAVVAAEVKHAEEDARRCIYELPYGHVYMQQHLEGDVSRHRLDHEVKAAQALELHRCLEDLDSDRHGNPSLKDRLERWMRWDYKQRVEWLHRRRALLHAFLHAAKDYQAARAAYDAPVARAA